jgi:asparagine synthase (glutamine-hydrolysing)
MCGIAGIVNFDPDRPVDAARLRRMRDILGHRGPDGEGSWIEGPVGLAHRRLAIVDIGGGAQPMAAEDGSAWITFNGEIYNHPELKKELEANNHRYRTRCDTETILHLYEEGADSCVERLSGMFAFALWDRNRRKLLLARDRLGIKPLYYAVTDRELLFASEIKAILASGCIEAVFNKTVLPEYLATGFVSGEETFFRGIHKLMPGRTLTWSADGGVQLRRYWRPPAPSRMSGSLKEDSDDLRARLTEAVRSHLMSDVPVGLFLSGGIDSAGLGALMASQLSTPIKTFSVGFQEPEADELHYAALAARSIGAEHHQVVVSADQFFKALPRLVWHEDEPIAFYGSVPLYFVSVLARQHVKVVLTGEGADELFWGYNKYRVTAWNQRFAGLYSRALPQFARNRVAKGIAALPVHPRRYLQRSFLALSNDTRSIVFDNFSVFGARAQESMLRTEMQSYARGRFTDLLHCYGSVEGSALERIANTDLQTYLVELLMKQDQMSMAASVESRVPYLDHQLVEHVIQLPPSHKIRFWQTKRILRKALHGLVPEEILTRKKMGFPVPIGRWLRGAFRPIVDEFISGPRPLERGLLDGDFLRQLAEDHYAGNTDHGLRLWLLINLEIWQRIFLDGEDPEAVMRPFEERLAAA